MQLLLAMVLGNQEIESFCLMIRKCSLHFLGAHCSASIQDIVDWWKEVVDSFVTLESTIPLPVNESKLFSEKTSLSAFFTQTRDPTPSSNCSEEEYIIFVSSFQHLP